MLISRSHGLAYALGFSVRGSILAGFALSHPYQFSISSRTFRRPRSPLTPDPPTMSKSQRHLLAFSEDNRSTAERIATQLERSGHIFDLIPISTDPGAPSANHVLADKRKRIVLLVTDNFLRSVPAMEDALPLLQQYPPERMLIVVASGVKDGAVVETSFARVTNVIQYMNFWQDTYLELRREKRESDKFGEESEAVLGRVRSISNEVGEFLREVRNRQHATLDELQETSYASFFAFVNDPAGAAEFARDFDRSNKFMGGRPTREEVLEQPSEAAPDLANLIEGNREAILRENGMDDNEQEQNTPAEPTATTPPAPAEAAPPTETAASDPAPIAEPEPAEILHAAQPEKVVMADDENDDHEEVVMPPSLEELPSVMNDPDFEAEQFVPEHERPVPPATELEIAEFDSGANRPGEEIMAAAELKFDPENEDMPLSLEDLPNGDAEVIERIDRIAEAAAFDATEDTATDSAQPTPLSLEDIPAAAAPPATTDETPVTDIENISETGADDVLEMGIENNAAETSIEDILDTDTDETLVTDIERISGTVPEDISKTEEATQEVPTELLENLEPVEGGEPDEEEEPEESLPDYLSAVEVREQAVAHFEAGETDEGLELYRRYVAYFAGDAELRFDYAIALLRERQDLPTAALELEHVHRDDPGNANAAFLLAEIAQMQGNYGRALDHYEATLEVDTDFPRAHLQMAELLLEKFPDRTEDTLDHFRKAVKQDKKNTELRYRYALLLADKDPERAERQFHKVIEREPDHPHAWYDLALLAHRRGDTEAAAEAYVHATDNNPSLKTERNEEIFSNTESAPAATEPNEETRTPDPEPPVPAAAVATAVLAGAALADPHETDREDSILSEIEREREALDSSPDEEDEFDLELLDDDLEDEMNDFFEDDDLIVEVEPPEISDIVHNTPEETDELFETLYDEEGVTETTVPGEAELPSSPDLGPTVLITGATSGIGRATAELFARKGYRIIATGRRADRLESLWTELQNDFQSDAYTLEFDVREPESVRAALDSLPESWQTIDLLINNAGLARGFDPIHEGSLVDWDTMIDTNLKGLLYVTRTVSAQMVQRGSGTIINVASSAGKDVYANGNVYCATKHAVDALTRAMRLDLTKHGIRVGQVAPGHVEETEFAQVRFHGDEERAKIYEDFQPLKASDVAEAIYFMASRPAYVNIQDIVMYGQQQSGPSTVVRSGRED